MRIMHPYYIALICGFALGFASSKTTNSCNIWAHNALLCLDHEREIYGYMEEWGYLLQHALFSWTECIAQDMIYMQASIN